MADIPFTPGATVTLAVTTATARVAMTRGYSDQVMITAPAGGAMAFVRFGDSTVTAAITDTPIVPGTQAIFSIAPGTTHMAAITGATTQTLYATSGNGS